MKPTLIAVVLLLLTGCPPPGLIRLEPYSPMSFEAQPQVTDGDLYAAAVGAFDDMALPLDRIDQGAGIVTSRFFRVGPARLAPSESERTPAPEPDPKSPMQSYVAGIGENVVMFHRWRVRIAEGQVRLMLDCRYGQILDGWPDSACPDSMRSASVVDDSRDLLHRIDMEALQRAERRARRAATPH